MSKHKHEWRYSGSYGNPRGSRYGIVVTQRCAVCCKTRKWSEQNSAVRESKS